MRFSMRNSFKGFVVLLTFALSGCSGFLYYPDQKHYVEEVDLPVRPTTFWIPVENSKLHSWYFQSPRVRDLKPIIVFFHGNAQNLSVQFYGLYWLLEQGYDYLVFDYRGYGRSKGSPSPKKTVQDGMAVLRFVHAQFPERPIVVVAQSLGGAIAIRTVSDLKKEIPIALFVADSTFLSYKQAARGVLGQSWVTAWLKPFVSLFLSDRYAPLERVKDLSPTPLLVIHGTADSVIPFALGKQLFEAARDPKEFWEVEGGQHVSAFWGREDTYRVRFISKMEATLGKL